MCYSCVAVLHSRGFHSIGVCGSSWFPVFTAREGRSSGPFPVSCRRAHLRHTASTACCFLFSPLFAAPLLLLQTHTPPPEDRHTPFHRPSIVSRAGLGVVFARGLTGAHDRRLIRAQYMTSCEPSPSPGSCTPCSAHLLFHPQTFERSGLTDKGFVVFNRGTRRLLVCPYTTRRCLCVPAAHTRGCLMDVVV